MQHLPQTPAGEQHRGIDTFQVKITQPLKMFQYFRKTSTVTPPGAGLGDGHGTIDRKKAAGTIDRKVAKQDAAKRAQVISLNVSFKIYHTVNCLRSFLSSGNPVIWSSGHPFIRSSDHLVILSSFMQSSGHLVIQSSFDPT